MAMRESYCARMFYRLYDKLVKRDFVWRCANRIAQGYTYKGFPLIKRDFVSRWAMRESYCVRMYLSYFRVALFFVVFPLVSLRRRLLLLGLGNIML